MKRLVSQVAFWIFNLALQAVCSAEPSQPALVELRSGTYVPFAQQQAGVEVRGFAADSGVVVLPENGQLGLLLRDLSLLSHEPKLSSLGIAERMAWLFGGEYRLVRRPLDLPRSLAVVAVAPRRVREPDGTVTLHFLLKRASHPGTVQLYAATLHCSLQYQAHLSLQRIR